MPHPPTTGAPRPAHPVEPALVGGVDLSSRALGAREDTEQVAELAKMLANAEYWISFDLARFEPILAQAPSPLRELGVAVLLKYGEDVGGTLRRPDLARAKDAMQADLPEDIRAGVLAGLESLERAVEARDATEALCSDGFARARREEGMAAHALRAMGAAKISIEGVEDRSPEPELPVGAPLTLSATDERGRPLSPPEIESRLGAEVLVRDEGGARRVVFLVPGRYQIRVPTKATGARKILAR